MNSIDRGTDHLIFAASNFEILAKFTFGRFSISCPFIVIIFSRGHF